MATLLFFALGMVLITISRPKIASASGEPLLLTPLIRQGQLIEAKEKCQVHPVAGMDLESYSGYLTVRGLPDDANLFFWFFPAVDNRTSAPIFLYLNGGPGVPSIQDLFLDIGPYKILPNDTVVHRDDHWVHHFNMIFMDFPVGSGYSFASSAAAYNRNLSAMGKDLTEGVQQFFTLFSEYATNDFYIVTSSYAAKYATILVQMLHMATQSNGCNDLSRFGNLKGIIAFGGYLTPDEYAGMWPDFCRANGLLTAEQHTQLKDLDLELANNIKRGNFDAANTYLRQLTEKTLDHKSKIRQLLYRFTGFESLLNFGSSTHDFFKIYADVLQRADVRRAIHVGATSPFLMDKKVRYSVDDMAKNEESVLEAILDQRYRVLLMYGTGDMLVTPLGAQRMVERLRWKGKTQFRATARAIWKVQGDPEVAGYVTPGQDLWFAAVRNAGHIVQITKTRAALDLVIRFTSNNTTF